MLREFENVTCSKIRPSRGFNKSVNFQILYAILIQPEG